jgi:DNA-binding NtrC family response regulator
MTEDRETIEASPPGAGEDDAPSERDRAFLIVYRQDEASPRTRVVDLHDGIDVIVGRSRDVDVTVESETVSRTHARIVRRGGAILVEDLGSRNGTRVNGALVTGPTRVSPGDEIAVGPLYAIVGVTTRLQRRASVAASSVLEERLAAESDRAHRYHRPLALLMIRVEGSGPAADAAVDRVAAVLRRMDCIGEYGPDEYGVILPEADRPAAEATARRLVREATAAALARGGAAIHVGAAVHGQDAHSPDELVARARTALRRARVGAGDQGVAAPPAEPTPGTGEPVIASPEMHRLYAMVRRIADTSMVALIQGETGAGKELVAEALHRESSRAAKRFVKLNCASLPETLLESELFGYERGAFTGAERRKLGYFEAAQGGTLLLDEIGEVPLALQAKLLRVLETRKLTRLGGTTEIEVDARVVCATNRDLEGEVRRGRFREDLFFRVSAFTLIVPPLRDRRPEIAPLARRFAHEFALELRQTPPRLAASTMALLEAYDWPGNVRELRNALERAVVLCHEGTIEPEHLPERVREGSGAAELVARDAQADIRGRLAEVERAAIVAALAETNGNQTQAARKLSISRRALIYKLEKYGLKPPPGGR